MSWNGKNVLVTGGAGFIGSHLCEALIARGCNITVIDKDFGPEIEELYNNFAIDIVNRDIISGLSQLRDSYDYIFHLAAYAVPTLCEKNPIEAFLTNVRGTYELLKYATNTKSGKVVFTSTALLYGREPIYLPIDEKHPIDGTDNVYSITKKLGEDICRTFRTKYKIPIAILRLFNTYGPRQTEEYLIPTMIKQAMNSGIIELWSDKPKKDFNYVLNVVDALLSVAESDVMVDVLNVGSGEEVSISSIARTVASEFDAEVKFLNKEVIGSLRSQCDYKLISDKYKWRPKISFNDGLTATIRYFKEKESSKHENKPINP